MRYIDIVTRRPELLTEQAFPLRVVHSKLMDRTYQINMHLLLLTAFLPGQDQNHWKGELRGWLREIGRWRVKAKGNPPVSEKSYMDYLWRGPFEGHEEETVEGLLAELQKEKPSLRRNQMGVPDLLEYLRQWHEAAAKRIAAGQPTGDLLDRL